ncbi:hypothetical protein EQH57_0697 [Dictyocoela roeselum]|nr:hypothetical protein EQH57_0697 [Dictyocoela roeselum]
MPFSNEIKNFLTKNKIRIHSKQVKITIGNESCDIDSFISSLIVAYSENTIHVVNMNRDVFESKGELMLVLGMFKIDIDDLIFFERFSYNGDHYDKKIECGLNRIDSIEARGCTQNNDELEIKMYCSHFRCGNEIIRFYGKRILLFLTDHNNPIPELEMFKIDLIIDHHKIDKNIENVRRVYIDEVGSATSLVSKLCYEKIIKKYKKKLKINMEIENRQNWKRDEDLSLDSAVEVSNTMKQFIRSMSTFILIPIIIDTHNLKINTSFIDKYEYKKLKRAAHLKNKDLKKLKFILKKSRLNDENQSTITILKKDFKADQVEMQGRVVRFGSSTVKYDFKEWVNREINKNKEAKGSGNILLGQIDSFRKEKHLDFLFVSHKFKNNRYIIAINCPFIVKLKKKFGFKDLNYKDLVYYKIPADMSRKVCFPIFRNFIKKYWEKM